MLIQAPFRIRISPLISRLCRHLQSRLGKPRLEQPVVEEKSYLARPKAEPAARPRDQMVESRYPGIHLEVLVATLEFYS